MYLQEYKTIEKIIQQTNVSSNLLGALPVNLDGTSRYNNYRVTKRGDEVSSPRILLQL